MLLVAVNAMSAGLPSSSGFQSDAFTETDLSVEPFSADGAERTSQMPSAGQQRGPDTDSDSGDSLFITQKCVPERRRRSSKRSDFRAHRVASEHEYDTSTSEEEQRRGRERRTGGYRTPRFTFPFLQKTLMTRLPYYQNRKLHYYAMGGYLRCAEELWESYQTGEGLVASLRTVDMDGEPLSPMSEDGHDSAEDDELKVVDKKLFVASKAKRSQPWYNANKTSGEETRRRQEESNTGSGSRRGQSQTPRPTLTGASSSNDTSCLKTKESDGSPADTETGETNRSPRKSSRACDFSPKETGEPLVKENGAALVGLSAERCGRASTEPHTGLGEQIYVGDDDECSRIKGKKGKKKKKKKRDKRGDERVDEEPAEGQPADPSLSVNVAEAQEAPCMEKKKKKKRESKGRSQEVDGEPEERKEDDSVPMWESELGGQERRETEEPTADGGHVAKKRKKKKKDPDGSSVQPQTPTEHPEAVDRLGEGGASQETLDPGGIQRKKLKKKRKKKHSPPDDNQTDVDLTNDAATVAEDADSAKKKKPKKLPEQEEGVDDAQKEQHDAELESRKKKKKKKKKKIREDISVNNAVDSLACGDNTELVHKKKKKKKKRSASFLSADTEENIGQSHEEQGPPVQTSEVSAGDWAAQSADVSEHLQEPKGVKKKKQRSAAPPASEETERTETSEAAAETKRKRKRTENLAGGLASAADEGRSPQRSARRRKRRKGSRRVPSDAAEHAESAGPAPAACGSPSDDQPAHPTSTSSPTFPSAPGTTSSRRVEGKVGGRVRRRLHNPEQDFLSEPSC